METKTVVGFLYQPPEAVKVCVHERPDFRYAFYTKGSPTWWGSTYYEYFFLVGIGSDRNMYVVENIDVGRVPLYVAGSNDLHFKTTAPSGYGQMLTYIEDFPNKLWRITEFGKTFRYVVSQDVEKPFIPTTHEDAPLVGGVSVSNNGRWIAAEISNAGFIRIDTKTRALYGFSNYVHRYTWFSNPNFTFTISDDGSKIALFDSIITPKLYTLDNSCELRADIYSDEFITALRNNECPTDNGRLYAALFGKYDPNQIPNARPSGFSSNADTLYFDDVINAEEGSATIARTPLYADGFVQDDSIEYLALGDSFTSGEGDIATKSDGSSFYLPGTEANNECHVSERSYPFLLREQLDIASERMQSIACSGAQVLPDYVGNPNSYKGQGDRVSSLSSTELASKQTQALENFMPGIVTQLEFVKKHQPKTITLMGGGNDVGFAKILEYCASPTWQGVFIDDTCGYAVEDDLLRTMLGQSIQSQYNYTLMLLRLIRQASPDTSVYVIGYPSFISENEAAVCVNSAALNDNERVMINQGVTTMNTMLQAAATSMGVKYIDIQDVLEGGRFCEGSEYVTGLTDLGIDKIINKNTRESFHPNSLGHGKIADRIFANNFHVSAGQNAASLAQPIAFDALAAFGASEQRTALQQFFVNEQIVERSNPTVHLPAHSLEPNSTATLTMHSQPIQLGEVKANNNGGISNSITLPSSIKPGQHIVIIDGKSPSGEPVYYYQFVTVLSQQATDADGDGVPNDSDMCTFIVSWIDEVTGKDVCSIQPNSREGNHQVAGFTNQPDGTSSGAEVTILGSSEPDQSPGDSVLSGSENMTNNDSDTSGEVKGVHTNNALTKRAESNKNLGVIVGVIALSTLLVGYGILRAIRSQS